MEKINSLTTEQNAQILAVRDRLFRAATSTVTDRERAERAARAIIAPALTQFEIHWCRDLTEATSLMAALRAALRDSLRASLMASLSDSLSDSLRASLWDSLRDSLGDSPWAALRDSLGDSPWAALRDSLWDSPWDSDWLAFYTGAHHAGLVQYSPGDRARLDAYVEFAESAFALWVLPGHVICLEKPKAVTVENDRLIDLSWTT